MRVTYAEIDGVLDAIAPREDGMLLCNNGMVAGPGR